MDNIEKNTIPFEEFYQQYYQSTYGYVRKKINNAHDAEDLTCNAFLYCYDHYSEYDPQKASLATWLYLIVNSRIKNYYRDTKDMVDIETFENTFHTEGSEIDNALIMDEQRNILAKAINTLPERHQAIVVMKFFYNKNSNEIALELGMTPVNVRASLARALKKLEKYCVEHGIEEVI